MVVEILCKVEGRLLDIMSGHLDHGNGSPEVSPVTLSRVVLFFFLYRCCV